jgi:hypothetical protein
MALVATPEGGLTPSITRKLFLNSSDQQDEQGSAGAFLIVDIRTKLEQNTNIQQTGESDD